MCVYICGVCLFVVCMYRCACVHMCSVMCVYIRGVYVYLWYGVCVGAHVCVSVMVCMGMCMYLW